MDEVSRLKKVCDEISLEIETLKTRKKILLSKLSNSKIIMRIREAEHGRLRKKCMLLQREHATLHSRIIIRKNENRALQDEVSLLEEVRFNLELEIESGGNCQL